MSTNPKPTLEDALADLEQAAAESPMPQQHTPSGMTLQERGSGLDADEFFTYVDTLQKELSTNELTRVVEEQGFTLPRDEDVDAAQRAALDQIIWPRLPALNIRLSEADLKVILDRVYDNLIGLGPLGPLWRDPDITEIYVDGWDKIYVEDSNGKRDTGITFRNLEDCQSVARKLADVGANRTVNNVNPIVGSPLPGGRVQFTYGENVTPVKIAFTIRKFRKALGMDKLLEYNSLTQEMADFLDACVKAKANLVVSGGTGAGKTTLINAVSEFIPDDERIITIEDAEELELRQKYWLPKTTKEKASTDDTVIVTQVDQLVSALREKPDRIIIGEIRTPEGARVMMEAANTGHDGTMTTIHASNTHDAINTRLVLGMLVAPETPVISAQASAVNVLDVVVQAVQKRGKRYVSEISVIDKSAFDGTTVPVSPVYRSYVGKDGEVHRDHVAGVPEGSRLYELLDEVGIDPHTFDPPSSAPPPPAANTPAPEAG